jgi:ribA/ribD-fused uncharacterized protein
MEIYDIEELRKFIRMKGKVKIMPFWGHTPKSKNSIDKSCFSQWFPISFIIDEIEYKTAEHYMMAEKARLFKSSEKAIQEIVEASSPAKAKKLGRKVERFNDSVWKQHRFEIVCRGNKAKFEQSPDYLEFLQKTGSKVIVEASPFDKIWGIGMSSRNDKYLNPLQWNGLNLLGFALMKVRDELRK